MVAAGIPQLDVGLDLPVVDVDVGGVELEDANHVRGAVRLGEGRLCRVRQEVGDARFARLKKPIYYYCVKKSSLPEDLLGRT